MNLFRPYRAAEPERDETGRLVGIDRYQEVLGLGWKRFFLSGLLTMAGCLPLTLGVGYAVLSKSALVLLPASLLGGAAAGPFIACLYDTILRALRAAPGRWWANYQKAFAQNWRGSLVPGALTGLFLGCAVFAAMLLFAWATAFPGAGTIAVFLFSCLLFLILTPCTGPSWCCLSRAPRCGCATHCCSPSSISGVCWAWLRCSWSGGSVLCCLRRFPCCFCRWRGCGSSYTRPCLSCMTH